MAIVKLTNADGTTYGGCQWGEGVEHSADGSGELCGRGWIHVYDADTEEDAALVASFMNPIHGDFDLETALLWRCEGDIGKRATDWKSGGTRVKTLLPIPLPVITVVQRVEIAIRASLLVYHAPSHVVWANDWLNGKDRSSASAMMASMASMASAAESAWSARAAEWSAESAWSATASLSASPRAARAVAAVAAAWGQSIDLASIIRQVLGEDKAK